ncbi:hypothetical protein ACFVAJ_18620 [Agromyces sp. NPDC057679]|uniref:hypothetical protein n=1 Tax=Agromyces sp. NPDC057679 TaxID=3346207 RepID=UPI00366E5479
MIWAATPKEQHPFRLIDAWDSAMIMENRYGWDRALGSAAHRYDYDALKVIQLPIPLDQVYESFRTEMQTPVSFPPFKDDEFAVRLLFASDEDGVSLSAAWDSDNARDGAAGCRVVIESLRRSYDIRILDIPLRREDIATALQVPSITAAGTPRVQSVDGPLEL